MKTFPLLFALALSATPAAASSVVIDFDELAHGTIVNTQYQAAYGLTISAENDQRSFDLAVAFDSEESPTRDPDLEDPWSGGNLPSDTELGGLVIIQENNDGTGDGVADKPDDEGRRPAGRIIFDFENEISSFGFSLVDVEADAEQSTGYFLAAYLGGGVDPVFEMNFIDFAIAPGDADKLAVFNAQAASTWGTPSFGNNTANRIIPIGMDFGFISDPFDRVVIGFGGSGAVGDVSFTMVPSPTTFGAALALLATTTLRRRVNA